MAQRILTIRVCDRCATQTEAAHSHLVTLDGRRLETDLCDRHEAEFQKTMKLWLNAAEQTIGAPASRSSVKVMAKAPAKAAPKKATSRKTSVTKSPARALAGSVAAAEPEPDTKGPESTGTSDSTPRLSAEFSANARFTAEARSAVTRPPTRTDSARNDNTRRVKSPEARYLQEKMAARRVDGGGVRIVSQPTRIEAPEEIWSFNPELVDWTLVDFDKPVTALRDALVSGLPAAIPFQYHPDVLALSGMDLDIFDAAIRAPQRVEIRPETRTKKYPVLAFHRGDAIAIVGFREPTAPMVIAAYAVSKLEHDIYRSPNGNGGGGRRATQGLPGTVKAMLRSISLAGAEVEEAAPGAKVAEVKYKGQCLGKVNVVEAPKLTVQSDYQRIVRKMHAIDARG